MLPYGCRSDSWVPQGNFYTIDENYPDAVNGLLMYLDNSSNNSSRAMASHHTSFSAVGKKSFLDEFENRTDWRDKPIREWSASDVVQWICENVKENSSYEIEHINIDGFRVDGTTLLHMSEQEFVAKDGYYGRCLFNALHAHKAVGKKSFIDAFTDCSKWRKMPIKMWTSVEIVQWICDNAKEKNYDYEKINIEDFHVDGITLLNMSEQEFVAKDRYYGHCLFHDLHAHKALEQKLLRDGTDIENLQPLKPLDVIRPVIDNQESSDFDSPYSSSDSDLDYPTPEKEKKIKRSVGRPPKNIPPGRSIRCKKGKKCGKVWEFIRDLLLNPQYCPSYIVWENRETGVFRFVRSQEVARLWGKRRNVENCKMNYEKFSRAMRHNYKTEYLQPVLGRRLVYKFGSRATGWQLNDVNFRVNPH